MSAPAQAAIAGAAVGVEASGTARSACSVIGLCTHSISKRLSQRLAVFTMVVLGLLFTNTWFMVEMLLKDRNAQDQRGHCELIADVLALEARSGGEAAVLARLQADASMRGSGYLEVWRADGQPLYADPVERLTRLSRHQRVEEFAVATPTLPGGGLRARYTADFGREARLGQRWAWILVGVTLAAGAAVYVGTRWQVRSQLRPLRDLAAQTRAISPGGLDQRLALSDPAEELLPWIEQFNALMARLQRAYAQLEGFNADVAHELRTPLASLIGQTEVALARERPVAELRETLVSNLEELQRLSALINDMLFLSQADRGATARREGVGSLATLVQSVLEFHEAPLEDAGLRWQVQGDARLAVDESLVQRALSNLVGNATRFARPGSTVRIALSMRPDGSAQVLVGNEGPGIPDEALPRLFDRFYRAEASRCAASDGLHHGLGLAIVAAIARMHGGQTMARSAEGLTEIGFTLGPGLVAQPRPVLPERMAQA